MSRMKHVAELTIQPRILNHCIVTEDQDYWEHYPTNGKTQHCITLKIHTSTTKSLSFKEERGLLRHKDRKGYFCIHSGYKPEGCHKN